ncbi:hypothetical protein GCM10022381_26250 [Leifsonia kafniensis]|uniref:Uncharacterized protein n=1 Tax=Leifsonia kafniensis TaxID=475957 RepID=A0ABP7KQY2_9MICO
MSEKASDNSTDDYPEGVPADEKPERFEKPTSQATDESAAADNPDEEDQGILSEPSTERDEEIPAADGDGASSE